MVRRGWVRSSTRRSSVFDGKSYKPDADELVSDEMPLDDENVEPEEGRSEYPLTSVDTRAREEFLMRGLRLSRARPEVLDYARREFVSSMCGQRTSSKSWVPRTFRFNETLGVDLFEIESSDGSKIAFCNVVCWGTLYQLCIPILDKTAVTVRKFVAERWSQYFGPPMLIIADQGKEFVGTQFIEFTIANSIFLHIIDVRAPW